MNLQETPAGQHFARFSRLYRGRERGIWERGRFEVSENNGVFLPDEVLTVERFVEHASGEGRSYGIHLLDAQNCVNFSMYDMDAHPRTAPAPEMLRQLRMLKPLVLHMCATLYDIGIARENLLLEFSGTGYHLWLFYAEPSRRSKFGHRCRGHGEIRNRGHAFSRCAPRSRRRTMAQGLYCGSIPTGQSLRVHRRPARFDQRL
jgi:hypothetical protein